MKNFFKQNWFKLVILVVLLIIALSLFYYFVILGSQREARIQKQAEIDLAKKTELENQELIKLQEKELEEQQKALESKNKAEFDAWVNKCITDAYTELKTLQGNYQYIWFLSCQSGSCADKDISDKASEDAFKEYQNEWIPQCKLGNRVFLDYKPY